MVANFLKPFKHSTKSYTKISDTVSLPEKSGHSIFTSNSFTEKFHSQKTSPTPKWLHKTHNDVMKVTQEWDNYKKQESVDHAFNALTIQQDLNAYKRDTLSQSKSKRSFSCMYYFSKEHKMGRALNQEMTHAFHPFETRKEKYKRWGGEAIRGATQPLDILPRNILKAFAPLPPGLSNLINHAALTFLDPIAQQAADVGQKLSPGSVVSKPDNMRVQQNGVSTAYQMNARAAQLKSVSEKLKIYFTKIAEASALNGKEREIKLKEIDSAIEELYEAMAETDEAINAYKGDTYVRKLKIRENLGQGLIRAAWAVSVTPVSKAFSEILGIPRADVLLRQTGQMTAAAIDYIHAQDYVRGRHIKSPIGIFTSEAITAGFHTSLPNVDRMQGRTLVLEHISKSPNCESIRNKFSTIPWHQIKDGYFDKCSKQRLNEILNSETECKCIKEFLFSPNKMQDKITYYSEERIDAIKYNAMQKMAEMQREKAKLYRRLEDIRKDISIKGNFSNYSEQNAKKCKVFSEKEVLDLLKKNQIEQDNFDNEYRLFEQASLYAQAQKNRNIKIDPNWAYSLEELYEKYPDSSLLKQLKSNTRLMWKTFTNNVVHDPSTWRNETLFRQNQFPVFAIDNTLSELNKIADNLPATDGVFHQEIVSFIANGAFFAPQVVISMWMYQENMRRFGRPKHHAFYVKTMLEKSRFILAQNKTEKVKLEYQLKNTVNFIEINKIKTKLDCVNFIVDNLPKQMASLELFSGNTQTFANLLDKPEQNIEQDTKIDLANSIAGMAAGLINPISSVYKRSNAIDIHGKALKLSGKINPQVKTGGINIPRTWYNIKTSINPYYGSEHYAQIKKVFEEHDANNVFDAFSIYSKTDNLDNGHANCPDNLTQVCFDVFNQISSDRIVDKSLFISKLSENNSAINNKIESLKKQLSNNLNNEKKLQIYHQAKKYKSFYNQIQVFLDRMYLPVEDGGFAGIIRDNKTITLSGYKGEQQKRNIDLSVSGHYAHALERDPFLDVKALNSKKIFTWGKTKNIAKTAVIPAARFLFEEMPRHLVTTPLTVIRGISDLEMARRGAKQTRIEQESIRRRFFSKEKETQLSNSANIPNTNPAKNLTDYLTAKYDIEFKLAEKAGDINIQQDVQNKLTKLEANSIINRAPRYKKSVEKGMNSIIQSEGILSNVNFGLLMKPTMKSA